LSIALGTHVCLLAMLVGSGASAQRSIAEPALLAGELDWLQRVSSSRALLESSATSLLPDAPPAVAASGASSHAAQTPNTLAQQRGRYRTMRVAGYLLAAAAVTLSIVAIPVLQQRKEHVSFYGEESCGPNLFPYLAAPAFAIGLGLGITGSVRDRELTREHRSIAARRTRWRSALAGVGAGLMVATLTSALPLSAICNS
jgi:hypothetical protein